nr:protein enabled homolog [Ipomoea batatas]
MRKLQSKLVVDGCAEVFLDFACLRVKYQMSPVEPSAPPLPPGVDFEEETHDTILLAEEDYISFTEKTSQNDDDPTIPRAGKDCRELSEVYGSEPGVWSSGAGGRNGDQKGKRGGRIWMRD